MLFSLHSAKFVFTSCRNVGYSAGKGEELVKIYTSVFLMYRFRWRPYNTANAPLDAMARCVEDFEHCSNLMTFRLASSHWYLDTAKNRMKKKKSYIEYPDAN